MIYCTYHVLFNESLNTPSIKIYEVDLETLYASGYSRYTYDSSSSGFQFIKLEQINCIYLLQL